MDRDREKDYDGPPNPQPGMAYVWYQAVYGSAICQLIIGLASLACGIAVVAMHDHLPRQNGAIELWTPLFFLAAGVMGIFASRRDTDRLIKLHMVFSVLSILMAIGLCINSCFFSNWWYSSPPHIALIIFSILEFIAAIVSTVLCCQAVCCV